MESARLGRWTSLIFLLPLFNTDPAFAASVCEQYLSAVPTVKLLEDDHRRLSEQRALLEERVEALKSGGDAGQDRAARITRLEGVTRQKEEEVRRKEEDKARKQRELSQAEQERSQYRAAVAEAQRKVREEEGLDALDKRLGNDPGVSALRGERERRLGEFRSLFGNREPDDIAAALERNPDACGELLKNTEVCEIDKAVGRSIGHTDPAGTQFGEWVGQQINSGKLTPSKVTDLRIRERAKLKELAKRLQALQGEIRKAENLLLSKQEQDLRTRRARAGSSTEAAREALADAQRSLQLNAGYVERLNDDIGVLETDLAALKQELEGARKVLEREKATQSPLEAAQAELDRVRSELAKRNLDLDAARKDRDNAKAQLQLMSQGSSAIVAQGLGQKNQAVLARQQRNTAACEQFRKAARDALMYASAKVAVIGECLDPKVLDRVNNGLREAEAIDCGSGSLPSGLVKVPPVKHMKWDAAEALIRNSGFTGRIVISEYLAPRDENEEGTAISTVPPAGQMVPPEDTVIVSIYNKKYVRPARADGDAWDAAASNARVSAVIRNPLKPDSPAAGPGPDADSQVDQARDVSRDALARGSTAEPAITHEGIAGVMGVASGIIASKNVRGKTAGIPAAQPGIRDIGPDPLPGIIPSSRTPSGSRQTAVPGSGQTTGTNTGTGSSTVCPTVDSSEGPKANAYFVIEFPGTPKGYEIRKVCDPPCSDADRMQCGTAKRCIEMSYSQMGKKASAVLGPFTSRSWAVRIVNERCR